MIIDSVSESLFLDNDLSSDSSPSTDFLPASDANPNNIETLYAGPIGPGDRTAPSYRDMVQPETYQAGSEHHANTNRTWDIANPSRASTVPPDTIAPPSFHAEPPQNPDETSFIQINMNDSGGLNSGNPYVIIFNAAKSLLGFENNTESNSQLEHPNVLGNLGKIFGRE